MLTVHLWAGSALQGRVATPGSSLHCLTSSGTMRTLQVSQDHATGEARWRSATGSPRRVLGLPTRSVLGHRKAVLGLAALSLQFRMPVDDDEIQPAAETSLVRRAAARTPGPADLFRCPSRHRMEQWIGQQAQRPRDTAPLAAGVREGRVWRRLPACRPGAQPLVGYWTCGPASTLCRDAWHRGAGWCGRHPMHKMRLLERHYRCRRYCARSVPRGRRELRQR